jgi:hypothetical protein
MNASQLRSVGAVFAGLVSNVVLTVALDMALSASGLLPPFGTGYRHAGLLSIALGYRTLFAGAGGFVTARLAPRHPRRHVAWLLAIGLAVGVLSVVAGRAMFPMWYLLAIVALSVPATWVGGALALRRGLASPRAQPAASR